MGTRDGKNGNNRSKSGGFHPGFEPVAPDGDALSGYAGGAENGQVFAGAAGGSFEIFDNKIHVRDKIDLVKNAGVGAMVSFRVFQGFVIIFGSADNDSLWRNRERGWFL